MTDKRLNWTITGEQAERIGKAARLLSNNPPSRNVREVSADDLDVVFQPIVSLTTGRQFAVEALVRCKWPEFEDPTVLFEHAVEETAAGRLGRYIREVAFSRCRSQPLFVNVHAEELASRWLVRPDDPVAFHDHEVYLEVTESAAFKYFDLCMSVLKEVCSRTGAKLAIDDLGAGYSNLKRVADLEPDVVKLDRELIRALDKSPRQHTLVTAVVRMCNELGAKVVAEGVETVDELLAVRDTGAQYVQGFLLARPGYPVPRVSWPAL